MAPKKITEPGENPLMPKVRKVTGELTERGTIGAPPLVGKPTDFRFGMDRDLDRLKTILEHKWVETSSRLAALSEFKAVTGDLKRRADRSGYALLSEVCTLFGDYISQVGAPDQERKVLDNYLDAILVISKKNLIGRGGMIGEEMIADLTKLNSRAGVRP